MATSSRARFRAEIPGRARAWFSAARDSGNRPAMRAALGQRPVQVDAGDRGRWSWRARGWPPAPPRPRRRPGTGPRRAGTPGRRAAAEPAGDLATALPEKFRGGPGGLADQQRGGAVQPAQDPLVHRLGGVGWPADRRQQLPGHPVGRRAGLGERPAGLAVPGGPHRGRDLLVQGGADHRVPEPEAAARLGQHAGGPGLVHGRDQVRDAPAEHGGQVGDGEVHAQQGGGAQDLPHPGGHEAEPVRDRRGQRARARARWSAPRFPRRRRSGWSCGPARPPAR